MDDKEKNQEEPLDGEEMNEHEGGITMSEEAELMIAQLEAIEAKAQENLDGWQRSQAEFANYKKRVARDQERLSGETRGRVIIRYLEIADDMSRALNNRPQDGDGADWANGVELVYRKLLSYLEAEGVTQMDVEGKVFDPNLHEAISQEESKKHNSGEIIEVLEAGYMLGDRVLRPAKVKVAQ
jgi:molecular chaperone GrpE